MGLETVMCGKSICQNEMSKCIQKISDGFWKEFRYSTSQIRYILKVSTNSKIEESKLSVKI